MTASVNAVDERTGSSCSPRFKVMNRNEDMLPNGGAFSFEILDSWNKFKIDKKCRNNSGKPGEGYLAKLGLEAKRLKKLNP